MDAIIEQMRIIFRPPSHPRLRKTESPSIAIAYCNTCYPTGDYTIIKFELIQLYVDDITLLQHHVEKRSIMACQNYKRFFPSRKSI